MRNVKVITPDNSTLLGVGEVKNFLRVDSTLDDTLIENYIKTATEIVESYLGRSLLNKTYKMVLDKFPFCESNPVYLSELGQKYNNGSIYLPILPVSSITSVVYKDMADASNTVSSTYYYLDDTNYRVCLKQDKYWSDFITREESSVEITFVAGYGEASDVPSTIKIALMNYIGQMYDSRGMCEMSCQCKDMLSPYLVIDNLWLT
jgi:uncharacterized phiE125 gp8 family phage protein